MEHGDREKRKVTIVSLAAAIALVAGKIGVGLATGSVALLADAAHSVIDFLATLVTFAAVRFAGQPPDRGHHYGHGKAESLAASFQTLLLWATALVIVYESSARLLSEPVAVDVTVWAIAVPVAGIAIDLWRSRMLRRVARKYGSQALEADALNFETDMWSSVAVVIGLAFVAAGEAAGRSPAWAKADAVAAIAVAILIMRAAYRLGRRSVDTLLDAAPEEMPRRIAAAVERVPGILTVGPVRLRESGSLRFADLTVTIARTESLARAHEIADEVEEVIERVAAPIDVVVHVEPAPSDEESPADTVRAVARRMGVSTHDERVHKVPGGLDASLHLELSPSLPLRAAHAVADELEAAIRSAIPDIRSVEVHLEPSPERAERRKEVTAEDARIVARIRRLADGELRAGRASTTRVRLYETVELDGRRRWDAFLACAFDPSIPLTEVHEETERLERLIRNQFPYMRQVVIHAEPV